MRDTTPPPPLFTLLSHKATFCLIPWALTKLSKHHVRLKGFMGTENVQCPHNHPVLTKTTILLTILFERKKYFLLIRFRILNITITWISFSVISMSTAGPQKGFNLSLFVCLFNLSSISLFLLRFYSFNISFIKIYIIII